MNPFDELLVHRDDLMDAIRAAGEVEGPEGRRHSVLRRRLEEAPELGPILAFLSRSGGDPHPFDRALQDLAGPLVSAVDGEESTVSADAVRTLGRELLDLPALPEAAEYRGGIGGEDVT
mgnify:CR=1 FL=1